LESFVYVAHCRKKPELWELHMELTECPLLEQTRHTASCKVSLRFPQQNSGNRHQALQLPKMAITHPEDRNFAIIDKKTCLSGGAH